MEKNIAILENCRSKQKWCHSIQLILDSQTLGKQIKTKTIKKNLFIIIIIIQ